jgi:hypothetical protein
MSGAGAEQGGERFRAALPAIRQKLAAVVEEASSLALAARDAELTDLERQAHAIRQQFEAMLAKLATTSN